jgi:hypothetical protein
MSKYCITLRSQTMFDGSFITLSLLKLSAVKHQHIH